MDFWKGTIYAAITNCPVSSLTSTHNIKSICQLCQEEEKANLAGDHHLPLSILSWMSSSFPFQLLNCQDSLRGCPMLLCLGQIDKEMESRWIDQDTTMYVCVPW